MVAMERGNVKYINIVGSICFSYAYAGTGDMARMPEF